MLWFDRGGLDAQTYSSLSEAVGARRPRVLAQARGTTGNGADVLVVALPDRLSFGDGEGWQHVSWQEIIAGGWDPRDEALSWSTQDGRKGHVAMTEPGELVDLFRERVTASIVVSEHVEVPGCTKGVTVTARRNPADRRGELAWTAVPGPDCDLNDPAMRAAVEEAVEMVRAGFDIG